MNPYEKTFRALNKAKVKYLVVGGVAVNLYGYKRFTGDIDILLALDEKNLMKMEKIMQKMRYLPRLPVDLHELGDKKKVQQWMEEKGLKAYTFLSETGPRLDIDIVVEDSLQFGKFYNTKESVEVWGINIPMVSFDHLLAMKRKAKRPKDLLDIEMLVQLKKL